MKTSLAQTNTHDIVSEFATYSDASAAVNIQRTAEVKRHRIHDVEVFLVSHPVASECDHFGLQTNSNTDSFLLVVQTLGTATYEQFGKKTVLKPGSVTLLDQRHFYKVQNAAGMAYSAYKVPASYLVEHKEKLRAPTSISIDTTAAVGLLLKRYLRHIVGTLDQYKDISLTVSLDVLSKVLVAAIANNHSWPDRKAVQHIQLNEIKIFIECNISDADLRLNDVAHANHISRRQLYRLFLKDKTTPYEWLKLRRLETAKEILQLPENDNKSVVSIADQCGFSDLAYFIRIFKSRFHVTPGKYRDLHGCVRCN